MANAKSVRHKRFFLEFGKELKPTTAGASIEIDLRTHQA
jgi:hypothetical protein